jgi:hypothetical protein
VHRITEASEIAKAIGVESRLEGKPGSPDAVESDRARDRPQ